MEQRIWIRRPGKTPTTISITPNDIIDDLKTKVIQKYPTTLAKSFDPADLIILLPFHTRTALPSPAHARRPLSGSLEPPRVASPLQKPKTPVSPQPITSAPHPLIREDVSDHPLECDQLVSKIVEQHFPRGMLSNDAFIVETPSELLMGSGQSQSQGQTQGHVTHAPTSSQESVKRINQNFSFPVHRRTQSSPHDNKVLLLPRNFSVGGEQEVPSLIREREEEQPTPHPPPSKPATPAAANGHQQLAVKMAVEKVLPSIYVLVVEDNTINQAILGAFLRKRKIKFTIAKNGAEAIEKWRHGGFHLVLMDIQLPVMSGIEATQEIRRLEKLNKIGVFANGEKNTVHKSFSPNDELDTSLFRSPVIIVALTASNSTEDKTEALAAGCNDFLTKPVNLVWLQNKITEWGCMQALVDFDNWKKTT